MRTADQATEYQQLDDLPIKDPEERRAQECRDVLAEIVAEQGIGPVRRWLEEISGD